MSFYMKNQFQSNGRSLWRYPKPLPIETHHHAIGILTFSLLSELNNDYLVFAEKIANFIISNMQDKTGFFYYRKYKWYTNRISYMRWSNSWMLLALSRLLYQIKFI